MKKHVYVGLVAAVLLLLVYVGIIALAQDLRHAGEQTARLWYWVLGLAGGFGIQAGLFSFIRQRMRERRAIATASVATSGGISAGSMAACCAHHLGDVLPLLGLSGLATLLVNYQLVFIVTGVLSNVVGITIMLETIQRHGLSSRLAGSRWSMNCLKKGAIVSSGIVLAATFLFSFSTTYGG